MKPFTNIHHVSGHQIAQKVFKVRGQDQIHFSHLMITVLHAEIKLSETHIGLQL